jgi:hypothetical protein
MPLGLVKRRGASCAIQPQEIVDDRPGNFELSAVVTAYCEAVEVGTDVLCNCAANGTQHCQFFLVDGRALRSSNAALGRVVQRVGRVQAAALPLLLGNSGFRLAFAGATLPCSACAGVGSPVTFTDLS